MKFHLLIIFIVLAQSEITPTEQTEFYKTLEPATDFYTETGYVSIDGPKNQFFYHLFLKEGTHSLNDVKPDDSFILWLNGGPGCSAMQHVFQNVGPFHILKKGEGDFTVVKSASAWSRAAHTIFLDQPFNVGLSFGDYEVQDSVQGAKYMVIFLEQFFDFRPTLAKTKFYVFGVSYGGHYVPALGEYILKSPELMQKINFQGIGVGNGWTDPAMQLSSFSSFFKSVGIMSDSRVQFTKEQMLKAQQAIFEEDNLTTTIEGFYGIFGIMDQFTGKISAYNFQQYEIDPNAEDLQAGFINQYKNQFQVPNQIIWTVCSDKVHENFMLDIANSYISSIEYILKQSKRILIYNGQLDVVCNTSGVTSMLNSINWDKISQWKTAPKQLWKALNPISQQREIAGTIKKFENLSFATVYMAGHMTPRDQPIASLEMLQHFLNDDDWI